MAIQPGFSFPEKDRPFNVVLSNQRDRTIFKKAMRKILSVLTLGLLCSFNISAETVSLVAIAPVGATGESEPLVIQTNQIAKLLHAYSPPEANPEGDQTRTPIIDVTIGTNTFEYVCRISIW